MVNIYELLINAVTKEEPKMLTGFIQNGKVTWLSFSQHAIRRLSVTGKQVEPNLFALRNQNTVSLYFFLLGR
jgi:hypothetical protein